MNFLFIWIIIAVVAFVLLRLGNRKLQIGDPRLGLLDLTDGSSTGLIQEDKIALRAIFSSWEESTSTVPRCDVLFLYATLGDGDTLRGTDSNLRETIRDSGAKIVVVASENPNPKPAKGKPAYGHANLVYYPGSEWSVFSEILPTTLCEDEGGELDADGLGKAGAANSER